MKTIVSIFLVIAAASALDVKNLIHKKVRVSDIFPKYTLEKWNELLNQQPTEEKYDNYTPGTKPQPAEAGTADFHLSSRIVGGLMAVPYQFPWQTFIIIDDNYACGGSLISDTWVLTAAHCAEPFTNFKVYLGAYNLSVNETSRLELVTETKIVHEDYNDDTYANDIALLKLPRPVLSTRSIRPIKLPNFSMASRNFGDVSMTTSGWGIFSDILGIISNVLRYVTVKVIPNSECAKVFGSYITSKNMCTSGINGIGTCNGDSGGALIYKDASGRYTEIGLTSFGSITCQDGYPSVYTRVTSYLKWISTNTGIAIEKEWQ